MFNSKYKSKAISACSKAVDEYKAYYDETISSSGELYSKKEDAVQILSSVDAFIRSIANCPDELDKTISEIEIRRKTFESEVNEIKIQDRKDGKINSSMASVGALAGAGVATFGPSAALGIATTFGTASTGTAIATLTGVAQTNAALAWLGGGALAAGGGGVAAGETFLALAGPVG